MSIEQEKKEHKQKRHGHKLADRLNDLLQWIYPTYIYCFCCGSVIDKSRVYGLCDSCVKKFMWATGKNCEKCGKPLGKNTIGDLCKDCSRRDHGFDKGFTCSAYGLYERRFVSEFKKRGKSYMAEAMGRILHDRIVIENIDFDVIIPIPIHEKKLRERGYNQALLMAKALSKEIEKPFCDNVIKRTKKTIPNKNLGVWERFSNMEGAFSISESGKKQIQGKTILIVDDIYTTGATASFCGRILKENGAKTVYILTFAAGVSS